MSKKKQDPEKELPQGDDPLTPESTAMDLVPEASLPQGNDPTTPESTVVDKIPEMTKAQREHARQTSEQRSEIVNSKAFDDLIHEIRGPFPKDLAISPDRPVETHVTDLVSFGDIHAWKLICKASSQSQGWMKTTKAMDMQGNVLIQTETQQRNADGTYSLSQSLAVVPGVRIEDQHDEAGKLVGRTLVRTH